MKFYPSSSAFMVGDLVVTKYNSGCLRSILIQSHGIREAEIPKLYQRQGAQCENDHAADLKAEGIPFVREFKVNAQLSPNVELSGRADFVLHHPTAGTIVDETKGCTSKNVRRDVIRKGEFNVNYLAQTVSYMMHLRTTRGRMVHKYYEETHDTPPQLLRQEERTFKVEIDDSGSVDVDGIPSGYCVADLLAHQRAVVRVLENQEIAARPDKWNQKYGGPCSYCPFKVACDSYDASPGNTQQFLESAQSALDTQPAKPAPVAFKIKKGREAS